MSSATGSADSRQPLRSPLDLRLILREHEVARDACFGLVFDDASVRGVRDVAHAHGHRGIGTQVLHPVRALTGTREHEQRRAVAREPDLDLVRTAADAPARRQVAEVVGQTRSLSL